MVDMYFGALIRKTRIVFCASFKLKFNIALNLLVPFWLAIHYSLNSLKAMSCCWCILVKRHHISFCVNRLFLFRIDWIITFILLWTPVCIMFSSRVLQYKNVRPDYLKNIWKVVNWKYANELYEKECPWGRCSLFELGAPHAFLQWVLVCSSYSFVTCYWWHHWSFVPIFWSAFSSTISLWFESVWACVCYAMY